MAKVRATVLVCDDPECRVERIKGFDIPMGLEGTVVETSEWGGTNAKWWACSREHVPAAMFEALRIAWAS